MKATVFHGVKDVRVDEVERTLATAGTAAVRVTLTTICETDRPSFAANTRSSRA